MELKRRGPLRNSRENCGYKRRLTPEEMGGAIRAGRQTTSSLILRTPPLADAESTTILGTSLIIRDWNQVGAKRHRILKQNRVFKADAMALQARVVRRKPC